MKATFICTVRFGRLVFAALVLMLTVCFSGSSVLAQNTGETKKDEPEDMFMLEEMTVTAQRKAESLQKASIAIDALESEALTVRGIASAQELSVLHPALTVTDGGGTASQVYMRGVGNRANNDYLDPAITLNYDGVPMARGSALSTGAFFDLERVEVLKGPQGTLYGRNATGGVINVIPAKPKLGEFSGYVNASYGNYSDIQTQAAVNIPLGENSAIRIAGNIVDRDGYNRDGTNDAKRSSIRAQSYTEISDSVNLRLAADYTDIGGVGAGTTPVGKYVKNAPASYTFIPNDLDPQEGANTPAANAYRNTILSAPGFGFLNAIQDEWYNDGSYSGVNAELNIETGIGTLTVIPAWRETKSDAMFGQPGFNSGWWDTQVEQKSVEVRLTGAMGDRTEYIVGGYYFKESADGNNTFNQEFVLPLQDYEHKARSGAIFSQLRFDLTDKARLVAGARYTDDHKSMDGVMNNFITFCGGLPPNNITPPASFEQGCQIPGNLPHWPTLDTPEQAYDFLYSNGWASTAIPIPPGYLIPLNNGVGQILHSVAPANTSLDENEPTYRVALEFDVAENSMIYTSYERGYRTGGLEPTGSTYNPEFIDAYTIGAKNRFANGKVQLNIEAFYWDYQDQQISYFNLSEQGVLQNDTQNVGKSTNKGVDAELLWAAAYNTLATVRVQYLDASYDDLHFYTAAPRDNIACPVTIDGTAMDFNCSGNQSVFSPEWTIQVGLEHTFDIGLGYLKASVFSQWLDDQVTGFWNLPHEVIDSHTRTDVDLTLTNYDDKWSVSAYARNLEDKRRVQSTQNPLLGMAMTQYGPPMTYGVRLNYNF